MSDTHLGIPAAALLLLLASCAPSSNPPGAAPRDPNRISLEEMGAYQSMDAYAAVQALRPRWLNTRGPSTINLSESIKVYLDNALLGGPDFLRQVSVNTLTSMRYMSGIEATQRWGLDHGLGAILLYTRDGDTRR